MYTHCLTLLCTVFIASASFGGPLPAPLDDDDFPVHSSAGVAPGQLLFYDPILSGNRNISCATCHHPKFATGDGVSLGIGEGGALVGTVNIDKVSTDDILAMIIAGKQPEQLAA